LARCLNYQKYLDNGDSMAEKAKVKQAEKTEEKAKEEKQEEERKEVTILNRAFMTVYPKLREPHKLVHVAYTYKDYPPRVVEIDLYEHFKDKQEEAEKQILKGEGDLAKKYFELERKAIKEDLEAMLKQKPETIEL